MNIVLEQVMIWFQTNKLTVNIDQTKFMMYHSGFNNTSLTDFSLEISGTTLNRIELYKFVGIWYDEKTNWKHYIWYISNTLTKVWAFKKKVRLCFLENILIQLYYSLVHPYMLYCHIIWFITYISYLDKIM